MHNLAYKVSRAGWLLCLALAASPSQCAPGASLRPPAVPLVACDPYFSVWSPADKLTDANTTHWTGKPHRLTSLARIDGNAYRIMGKDPQDVPALVQTAVEVLPTRTIYGFEGAGVALTLTFMTAALPENIELLSRPVTYLTYDFRAIDGKTHDVSFYFDASAELTVNDPKQQVTWSADQLGSLSVAKMGSKEQPVLGKKGDDLRIDWGYLYVAAPKSAVSAKAFAAPGALQQSFTKSAMKVVEGSLEAPTAAEGSCAAMAFAVGKVSSRPVSRWLMLAYDDIYSIQYFKQNLRPYWRRNGAEAADLLKAAAKDYESLRKRCAAFDEELMTDLTKAGGEEYARICALAYRQTWAGCKIAADANGQALVFPKENFSNGCIGTVDVIYPMAPQFILFGPTLTKAIIVQNLDYAASPRWKWPFAPHDLGTYPKANGQVYGGGERTEENQMPVEETGNMLVLTAALAQMEGNANFAAKYWPVLEKWAAYLKDKGFDPENQLCTDDFAGHLAHNVNLSLKAICGLASFGRLCEMRGEKTKAGEFMNLAQEFAQKWLKEADDGDHSRLAFDKPGTWSQKYNVVWDRILGLNLFPAGAWRKEMDFYKRTQNQYGLPLDNRQPYTKLDWTLWTATLTQERADFDALAAPVFRFLNATPDHSPMTDWYQTKDAHRVGFTARPVVGGVFLQMLYDKAVWKKWAGRDKTKPGEWAPLPTAAVAKNVVPTAKEGADIQWRYTTAQPAAGWVKPEFDDSSWQQGPAGFGTRGTPGAVVRTEWKTADIWMRREFSLPPGLDTSKLLLQLHHDEDAEIYINGQSAGTAPAYTAEYEEMPINSAGRATLRPGKNTLAVHCHQTQGGQYIDVGLASQ